MCQNPSSDQKAVLRSGSPLTWKDTLRAHIVCCSGEGWDKSVKCKLSATQQHLCAWRQIIFVYIIAGSESKAGFNCEGETSFCNDRGEKEALGTKKRWSLPLEWGARASASQPTSLDSEFVPSVSCGASSGSRENVCPSDRSHPQEGPVVHLHKLWSQVPGWQSLYRTVNDEACVAQSMVELVSHSQWWSLCRTVKFIHINRVQVVSMVLWSCGIFTSVQQSGSGTELGHNHKIMF